MDGTVLRTDRIYVGVRGEAGAPLALFDGDSLLAEAKVRIDGVYDFIAVALTPGPHRLRVRIANSWGQERWDSLNVHVNGLPARLRGAGLCRVAGGGRAQRCNDSSAGARPLGRAGDQRALHHRRWARERAPANPDGDGSSVGLQLQADSAGWIAVQLKPGTEVRRGKLLLTSGDARGSRSRRSSPDDRTAVPDRSRPGGCGRRAGRVRRAHRPRTTRPAHLVHGQLRLAPAGRRKDGFRPLVRSARRSAVPDPRRRRPQPQCRRLALPALRQGRARVRLARVR